MRNIEIKNKDGKVYMTTQKEIKNDDGSITKIDSKPLTENIFEKGDKFVCVHNKVYRSESKGKSIENYSIYAEVECINGKPFIFEESKEDKTCGFIKVTKTQAKRLEEFKKTGNELHRTIFVVYEYENKHGLQLGVGLANQKPALSLAELKNQ